ncbi:hypothetical protein ACIPC1_00785 [Streptomyces sp. NPDC087263]|uniref:hypothetical protein n=1 Tax=Streptomyces sp. NPDC087263 TaxID=3365773 RepID=UPI00380BBC6F
MAKNKNRKQGEQDRSSQAERAQEQAQRSSTEAQQSPMPQTQGSPADVARKHQKRFGHN